MQHAAERFEKRNAPTDPTPVQPKSTTPPTILSSEPVNDALLAAFAVVRPATTLKNWFSRLFGLSDSEQNAKVYYLAQTRIVATVQRLRKKATPL